MPEPAEQELPTVRRFAARRPVSWANTIDLVLCCAVLLLGAFAFAFLPGGSVARLLLVLPILFFIPGFLLLEALLGWAQTGRQRFVRAVVSIGVSPAVVGLLALATSILPGGFRPLPIVMLVTSATLAFGGTAYLRRRSVSAKNPDATATTA